MKKVSDFTSIIDDEKEVFDFMRSIRNKPFIDKVPPEEFLRDMKDPFLCSLIYYDKYFNVVIFYYDPYLGYNVVIIENFLSHYEFNIFRIAEQMRFDAFEYTKNFNKELLRKVKLVNYPFKINLMQTDQFLGFTSTHTVPKHELN